MEEWKTYKLGDVCKIYGRIGFRGYTIEDLVEDSEKGAISLSPTNIQGGVLDLSKPTYISWEKYYESPEIMIHENDIVIVKTGSSIGRTAIIRNITHPMTLNPQLVVLKDVSINKHFLGYLVKGKDFQGKLSSIVVGSAIPTLSQKNLANLTIAIPPTRVQEKISNILSSLDSKIELNNRINHNLEEQAQAMYKSWFVDFEPFKDGKFVESELGMIPEGWRVGSIYEHVNVIYGAPYKSALFNENKNGFPLIRIRDLKDCKPQFYTPELLPNSEFVMSGDIVAGMDADFSPHLWKGETGLLNQRVCKFEPIDKTISNYYVLMLIKPELEFISSYKVGTTVSHLGKADIDRIRVILPPLKIVRDFSIISEQLLQMIIAHSSECRILRTQLNTLLPKLMSGELKINEIDC